MKRINCLIRKALLLCAVYAAAVCPIAYSQSASDDAVLVKGDPPLTQLMAGKVIVLLDWALALKLSAEQELKIKQILIDTWRAGDRAEMRGALELIDIYEKVFRMTESDRNVSRRNLEELLLKNIRSQPDDELARMLLSAYETSRSPGPRSGPAANVSTGTASNVGRVGTDGFTGLYRMLRPRALNIISTVPESGYYIEHITFLPGGNVIWSLPPEGLLRLDPLVAQRADPDDWGTYEIKDGVIHILRGPGRLPYVITRSGERLNNPPSLGKGTFRPVPPADGLRLEGNYRRHSSEPTITFTKDGHFRDGGVFRFFGTLARPDGLTYQDDGIPGSGTYVIGQNTLELRYSDGRVKRHAFIAFPENLAKAPYVDSFILRSEERMSRY